MDAKKLTARLAVMRALSSDKFRTAGEIATAVDLAPARVVGHLKGIVAEGLADTVSDGGKLHYRITRSGVRYEKRYTKEMKKTQEAKGFMPVPEGQTAPPAKEEGAPQPAKKPAPFIVHGDADLLRRVLDSEQDGTGLYPTVADLRPTCATSPASVAHALRRLTANGYVDAHREEGERVYGYHVTPAGREFLREYAEQEKTREDAKPKPAEEPAPKPTESKISGGKPDETLIFRMLDFADSRPDTKERKDRSRFLRLYPEYNARAFETATQYMADWGYIFYRADEGWCLLEQGATRLAEIRKANAAAKGPRCEDVAGPDAPKPAKLAPLEDRMLRFIATRKADDPTVGTRFANERNLTTTLQALEDAGYIRHGVRAGGILGAVVTDAGKAYIAAEPAQIVDTSDPEAVERSFHETANPAGPDVSAPAPGTECPRDPEGAPCFGDTRCPDCSVPAASQPAERGTADNLLTLRVLDFAARPSDAGTYKGYDAYVKQYPGTTRECFHAETERLLDAHLIGYDKKEGYSIRNLGKKRLAELRKLWECDDPKPAAPVLLTPLAREILCFLATRDEADPSQRLGRYFPLDTGLPALESLRAAGYVTNAADCSHVTVTDAGRAFWKAQEEVTGDPCQFADCSACEAKKCAARHVTRDAEALTSFELDVLRYISDPHRGESIIGYFEKQGWPRLLTFRTVRYLRESGYTELTDGATYKPTSTGLAYLASHPAPADAKTPGRYVAAVVEAIPNPDGVSFTLRTDFGLMKHHMPYPGTQPKYDPYHEEYRKAGDALEAAARDFIMGNAPGSYLRIAALDFAKVHYAQLGKR